MLFVSCQPYKDEEYFTKDFILNIALAAKLGGARGLRIEGVENLLFVKKKIDLPIVGLIKKRIEEKERYICPDIGSIEKILEIGCDFIAIDYTLRDDCNRGYYLELSNHIHKISDCKIIADISTVEEAKLAIECNADYVSTTLNGYTKNTKNTALPNFNLIKQLSKEGIKNIIAEGGYSNHSQYIKALKLGAKIVVIGTAITRIHLIVKKIIQGHY